MPERPLRWPLPLLCPFWLLRIAVALARALELAHETETLGDASHFLGLVGEYVADARTFGSGASGASDAVGVGVLILGHVEVDHLDDVGDVDAACRDIGRDERPDLAALEARKRLLALRL